MGHHIPDRGPVGVRHRAGLDQHRPVAYGELLECRLGGERLRKPASNLGYDCGQIPRGDLDQAAGVGGTGRSLRESPAVHQEILPGPVGPDRLQHAAGLGRGCFDRRGQTDQPLGLVGGAVAGVGKHSGGDRPGGLCPGLVGRRRLLDAGEQFGCGLRLLLLEGFFDRLPRGGPGALRFVSHSGAGHGQEGSKDSDNDPLQQGSQKIS